MVLWPENFLNQLLLQTTQNLHLISISVSLCDIVTFNPVVFSSDFTQAQILSETWVPPCLASLLLVLKVPESDKKVALG